MVLDRSTAGAESLALDLRACRVRNALHSIVLVGGMLALLGAIGALLAGPAGFVFVGAIAIFVLLLSPRVSPALILRMYRARPLQRHEAPFLVAAVEALSARAGLSAAPTLFYLPSRMVNAFTLGGRDESVIGLTDGLLRSLERRELVGVLAHEISHIRSQDVLVMGLADVISRATGSLSFIGQLLLLLNLPLILMGAHTISWMAILLLILAPTVSSLLQLALSRAREYDADRGAVALTGDPRGLASALAKLERLNGGLFERIFMPGRRVPEPSLLRTHPPTAERIERLLQYEQSLEGAPALQQWVMPWDAAMRPEAAAVGRRPRWHLSGLWY